MIDLAELITAGALARNESRGAHYKPEFPQRNDDEWLKTTKGTYSENGPVLSYEDVELTHIKPVKRVYDVDNASGKGKELDKKETEASEEGK
jgi:succinate dehydrogenase / fumarate reductase flavoprotein subunit